MMLNLLKEQQAEGLKHLFGVMMMIKLDNCMNFMYIYL